MSKLALIIGEVEYCLECPLCSGIRCNVEGRKILFSDDITNKRRPEWCPLKELSDEEV